MSLLAKCIIIIFFQACLVQGSSLFTYHPDTGLNIYQLAERHGYPLETHQVITDDGYILTVHRIPHGRNERNNNITKSVVFMMHGILSSSTDWINPGPENSLAYLLADQGYDIWLGNARGNAESRKHKTLDPDKDKEAFWEFSWHEIGYFDLPAMIDYILKETNQKQLQYVGFSQGTTTFFVMATTRPEYNAKIKFCTLLAPAAEMNNMKNPFIKKIAPFENGIYKNLKLLGHYEILPRSKTFANLGINFCKNGVPTQEICKQVIFTVSGTDRDQLDGGFIPVIASNCPAGSSLKQLVQYMQIINGPFRQFDYHSKLINFKRYGSTEPPKYDLGKITAPVAMYYGTNDLLVSDVDAKLAASQMPNIVHLKQVDYDKWTHFNFIWGKDVVEILYKEVIIFINKYNE